MLRQVNFRTNQKPLWIVSDTHFNHDKEFLWKPRGFTNIQDHDRVLKERWNATVGPNDNVLHLGDFVINDGSGIKFQNLIAELNGHIFLLWGNHNSGVKAVYKNKVRSDFGRDDIEVYPLTYADRVTFLGDYALGFIDNVPYVASHFPFRIWDEMQHRGISLSGHSHSSDVGRNPDCVEGKALDCGIDNFGGPVSFQDIMKVMATKKQIVIDHHDKKTVSGRG